MVHKECFGSESIDGDSFDDNYSSATRSSFDIKSNDGTKGGRRSTEERETLPGRSKSSNDGGGESTQERARTIVAEKRQHTTPGAWPRKLRQTIERAVPKVRVTEPENTHRQEMISPLFKVDKGLLHSEYRPPTLKNVAHVTHTSSTNAHDIKSLRKALVKISGGANVSDEVWTKSIKDLVLNNEAPQFKRLLYLGLFITGQKELEIYHNIDFIDLLKEWEAECKQHERVN